MELSACSLRTAVFCYIYNRCQVLVLEHLTGGELLRQLQRMKRYSEAFACLMFKQVRTALCAPGMVAFSGKRQGCIVLQRNAMLLHQLLLLPFDPSWHNLKFAKLTVCVCSAGRGRCCLSSQPWYPASGHQARELPTGKACLTLHSQKQTCQGRWDASNSCFVTACICGAKELHGCTWTTMLLQLRL